MCISNSKLCIPKLITEMEPPQSSGYVIKMVHSPVPGDDYII